MTDPNGLYYMRARYYNPEIKRFITQDILFGEINDSQSLNRYAYVENCPILRVDPLGRDYKDLNLTLTYGLGLTGGILYDTNNDKFYWYLGPAVSPYYGGISLTSSPNEVTEDWNWGIQLSSVFPTLQIGGEFSKNSWTNTYGELGVGMPGGSISAFYVGPMPNKFDDKIRGILGDKVMNYLGRYYKCRTPIIIWQIFFIIAGLFMVLLGSLLLME